jgi:hypothetical protein
MANEVRLIDANALQRRICKAKCNREYEDCRDEGDCEFDFFIFWAPTIDPESLRPKGRWNVDVANLKASCSECGIVLRFTDEMQISMFRDLERFCYYCGADMRGDSE